MNPILSRKTNATATANTLTTTSEGGQQSMYQSHSVLPASTSAQKISMTGKTMKALDMKQVMSTSKLTGTSNQTYSQQSSRQPATNTSLYDANNVQSVANRTMLTDE